MAAMWRLPVLFVCENNRYQIGTEIHRQAAIPEIYKRACAYGMDVLAVHEVAQRMLRAIRSGQGPQLLELDIYRFRGHSMVDAGAYRSWAEVESYKQAGPLQRVEQELVTPVDRLNGSPAALDEASLQQLRNEVEQIVEDAVAFAEASPAPTLTEAWDAFHATRRNETLIRAEPQHG